MSVADIAAALSDGPLPFGVTAYDGSRTGRPDTPFGLHVATPRALQYLLTAPGQLGLARGYVAGDLQLIGVHPADPYPLLRLFADELRLRRPAAGELTDIARSVGWRGLTPIDPPALEAPPRWRRRRGGGAPRRVCGIPNTGTRRPSAGTTTCRTPSTNTSWDRR